MSLELLVLAYVGGHHFLDLARRQQNAHAEAVHAGVVTHDREPFHTTVVQRADQIFRNPAESEAARGDGHVIVQQAIECGPGVGIDFAHAEKVRFDESSRKRAISGERGRLARGVTRPSRILILAAWRFVAKLHLQISQ